MDWDDLRYALEVARAGSVTRAARTLGVAHTTVARRVAALEATSRVTLFDRVGGDCTLTPAGTDLLAAATEIEATVGALERRFAGSDGRLEGAVTIAAPELIAVELARHLVAFRKLHPRIVVQLSPTNLDVDLSKREADIAVRATLAPDESLVGRRLATLAFAVYGVSGANAARATPEDLARCDWVCFDESLAGTPQGKWEAAHVKAERVVLRTSSRAVFVEAIAMGAGVGILPCAVAAQMPNLAALTSRLDELSVPLWMLTHADLQNTPRVRALIDYLGPVFEAARSELEGAGVF